jgi:hypothetical protein
MDEPNEHQSAIDKMTLELLMNKTQYSKYVSKTDPKRHAEVEEYLSNIKKYRGKIQTITNDLLDMPTKPITSEVNDSFDMYMKTLVRYFKMKEVESANEYNKDGTHSGDEEDMLFGNMDINDEETLSESVPIASFWGKDRIIKKKQQASITAFSMGVIPRKKEDESK